MPRKIKTCYSIWIQIKCVLFTLLGLFCGFYFVVCLLYGGIRLSWLWIWLLLAVFFFVRVIFLYRERNILLTTKQLEKETIESLAFDEEINTVTAIDNKLQDSIDNNRKKKKSADKSSSKSAARKHKSVVRKQKKAVTLHGNQKNTSTQRIKSKIKSKNKFGKIFTIILRIGYRILFLFAATLFLLVESRIINAMNTQEKDNLPYVIILGAGLKGSVPTRPLLLRMEKAYEYMSANPDTILIASGGQGPDEDISEGECIKNYLTARGIAENRILVEDQSTSTEENIAYSFALLPEDAGEVGILSNSFHIYRAVKIANLQGHDNVSGVPAKTLLPLGIHYTVREFFGCVKLFLSSQS